MSSPSSVTKVSPGAVQSSPIAPVIPLDNSIANTYKHIHPLVVASTYAIQFNAIVADPVRTLAIQLVPTALLQLLYCILCLPPSGSAPAVVAKPGMKKKALARNDVAINKRLAPALLSLLLSLIIGPPITAFLLVLFGAPFTTHLPHTGLTALHISILAGLPLVYAHGVDTTKWRHVAAMMLPLDEVFGAAVGTALGAWAGAVPIPLDWDREWQQWPITIVTGAYIGWAIGKTIGGTLLRGKVISLES